MNKIKYENLPPSFSLKYEENNELFKKVLEDYINYIICEKKVDIQRPLEYYNFYIGIDYNGKYYQSKIKKTDVLLTLEEFIDIIEGKDKYILNKVMVEKWVIIDSYNHSILFWFDSEAQALEKIKNQPPSFFKIIKMISSEYIEKEILLK